MFQEMNGNFVLALPTVDNRTMLRSLYNNELLKKDTFTFFERSRTKSNKKIDS